jgi:hypothetical protein
MVSNLLLVPLGAGLVYRSLKSGCGQKGLYPVPTKTIEPGLSLDDCRDRKSREK